MTFCRRGDPWKGCGPLDFTRIVDEADKGLSDEQRQQQQVDRNLFAVAVDAFIDCAWRGDGHYSGHWEAATDEQRQRIRGHVEADVESWLRQGDIHRGQTPLEYLAAKDREQEERR